MSTAAAPTTLPAPAGRRRLRRAVPRLLLIVNPAATRLRDGAAEQAEIALRDAYRVTTVDTEARGHAAELAHAAAGAGYELVAVLGGDGTVNEAAGALAGSDTALTCLPAGCTDVFARSVGIPRDAAAAAARLAGFGRDHAARTIDLGTVNGRHFLSTAGLGISASMTAAADEAPERKARFGQLHFTGAAVAELGRRYLRNPPRMRVHAGDRTLEGVTAMVQNSHALTYFGPREIRLCPGAGLETGTLSLTVLHRAQPRDVPSVVARLVSGRPGAVGAHPRVETVAGVPAADVAGVDGAELPIEADGEFLGYHRHVRLGIAPGALRVLA